MDAHNTCELVTPIEVEINFVNRVTVNRNSGSLDSPSVLAIPTAARGSVWREVRWVVRSVGKISFASLSMTDTGTPEFVNRIWIPWLVQGEERGSEHTIQGVFGVSGLTSLPARSGKLDNVSASAILNLSTSKSSGIM